MTLGARSSTKLSMPSCDSSFDRVRPVGPAPTITTGALAADVWKPRPQTLAGPSRRGQRPTRAACSSFVAMLVTAAQTLRSSRSRASCCSCAELLQDQAAASFIVLISTCVKGHRGSQYCQSLEVLQCHSFCWPRTDTRASGRDLPLRVQK